MILLYAKEGVQEDTDLTFLNKVCGGHWEITFSIMLLNSLISILWESDVSK